MKANKKGNFPKIQNFGNCGYFFINSKYNFFHNVKNKI